MDWRITEEQLSEMLNEAFEEGYSGYKENQESVVKRMVRRFAREQEKNKDKEFVEALKNMDRKKKAKKVAVTRPSGYTIQIGEDGTGENLEWVVNDAPSFTTTVSPNPNPIYSYNDINAVLSGLEPPAPPEIIETVMEEDTEEDTEEEEEDYEEDN